MTCPRCAKEPHCCTSKPTVAAKKALKPVLKCKHANKLHANPPDSRPARTRLQGKVKPDDGRKGEKKQKIVEKTAAVKSNSNAKVPAKNDGEPHETAHGRSCQLQRVRFMTHTQCSANAPCLPCMASPSNPSSSSHPSCLSSPSCVSCLPHPSCMPQLQCVRCMPCQPRSCLPCRACLERACKLDARTPSLHASTTGKMRDPRCTSLAHNRWERRHKRSDQRSASPSPRLLAPRRASSFSASSLLLSSFCSLSSSCLCAEAGQKIDGCKNGCMTCTCPCCKPLVAKKCGKKHRSQVVERFIIPKQMVRCKDKAAHYNEPPTLLPLKAHTACKCRRCLQSHPRRNKQCGGDRKTVK